MPTLQPANLIPGLRLLPLAVQAANQPRKLGQLLAQRGDLVAQRFQLLFLLIVFAVVTVVILISVSVVTRRRRRRHAPGMRPTTAHQEVHGSRARAAEVVVHVDVDRDRVRLTVVLMLSA
jgi:heme/copper-type cytochrome/quinol oxidase subunit 2